MNNIVYLVSGGWNYGKSKVVKAFSTRISAERFANKFNKKNALYDYVSISEMKIEQ